LLVPCLFVNIHRLAPRRPERLNLLSFLRRFMPQSYHSAPKHLFRSCEWTDWADEVQRRVPDGK
jgi:hypothetical protein